MRQVDEHTATCAICHRELTTTIATARLLHTHMPVLKLDNSFVNVTLDKIAQAESTSFLKLIIGIMVVLTFLLLTGLLIISPIFISLLWLISNILLTLIQQGALLIKIAPLLQILSGTVLTILLFIVLVSIRRLAVRRIA